MNISYNWLKDYINTDLKPGEIAPVLTDIGLEVEAVETYEQVKGGMKGLVIGKVLTCEKHPNADKLSVTTVDIGKGEPLHIVCGAPNVEAGQKVVVAPVGATLYKGDESLTLQKIKIRGEVSEGMICAEDEIGIGNRHEGIIVLEDDVPVGIPAGEYYHIEQDTVFVIGLTPNRIDSCSHYGTARDLAAFLSQNSAIQLTKPDVSAFRKDADDYPVEVIIENVNGCRRYAGISVTGVTIAASPDWLQNKLLAIGQIPISNIVDITNFVLHELGQPLHAFDADRLAGQKIIVKNMPDGTRFTTLDGQEHALSSDDLMICDGERPVALAGLFGGLESGITDTTKNVFIESACFDPVTVRRTSKRLGISTDASFIFERGVDPTITILALKRAAMLMKELAGGKIASDIIDIYPSPIEPCTVELSYPNIDRLIGKKIEHNVIRGILEKLEFKILREDEQDLSVLVPAYRIDVTREADVIEEILRIYGYNNVEISRELHGSVSYTSKPDREKLANAVSDYLTGNGFNEIICNSLTRAAYYDNLDSYQAKRLVRILNPLSNDLNVLRQTLLFGGLESIVHNTNRKNPDLMLYEFGTCYFYDKTDIPGDPLDNYSEHLHLALFLTGRKYEMSWLAGDENYSFFDLKAYVENIFRKLGFRIDDFQASGLEKRKDIFSDGIAFRHHDKLLAELGVVSRQLLKKFDLKADVFYANLYWDRIIEMLKDIKVQFSELPKFPEVKRDLSMILDKSVTYDQIKKLAYQTGGKILKHVHLFDVYEGKGIESGKKSYAVNFVLQDLTKTLVDSEIDEVMNRLMSAYEKNLNAKIRK
ncbi:MAG: phenylalanine--tRNA ligase subunit beta [Bacteroidales bacterium]|nr:phenylalanine--tRNA ligase subunit beta [Bacteroidales bacterium]